MAKNAYTLKEPSTVRFNANSLKRPARISDLLNPSIRSDSSYDLKLQDNRRISYGSDIDKISVFWSASEGDRVSISSSKKYHSAEYSESIYSEFPLSDDGSVRGGAVGAGVYERLKLHTDTFNSDTYKKTLFRAPIRWTSMGKCRRRPLVPDEECTQVTRD